MEDEGRGPTKTMQTMLNYHKSTITHHRLFQLYSGVRGATKRGGGGGGCMEWD